MTNPTPEERAEFVAERLGRYSAGWLKLEQIVCIDAMRQQQGIITAEIRAAIATEREACARVADNERDCCERDFATRDDPYLGYVAERITAAIRARGEKE
jgi:hypothetical protein